MERINEGLTILHVEDDSDLVWIVRRAFEDFGFSGAAIAAESVTGALDLLNERERNNKPLSLIISDIRLPDGSGLDLIREMKTNPYWRMTPVIVLSGDRNPTVINAAYAVGANSYLPKDPPGSNLVSALESLYKCWLENVQLPSNEVRNRVTEVLDRGIGLRARTAEFYVNLARHSGKDSEVLFWLDRALGEGNLSNLLAFFRDKLSEHDFAPATIDRLASSQSHVANALITVEKYLKSTSSPDPEILYDGVLNLAVPVDEEVFINTLAGLFQKSLIVTAALRARAVAQFEALATYILERTQRPDFRQKGELLLNWSRRIEKTLG